MKTLFLMIGLPGAGKSTFVNKLANEGVQVVCPDDIRRAFGHAFWGPLEPMVHAMAYQQARALMSRGFNVVIDEPHTRAEFIRRWRNAAVEFDYHIRGVHFVEICVERRDDEKFSIEVIARKQEQLKRDLDNIINTLDSYTVVDPCEVTV